MRKEKDIALDMVMRAGLTSNKESTSRVDYKVSWMLPEQKRWIVLQKCFIHRMTVNSSAGPRALCGYRGNSGK